jgi:ATP-dependent DNA helicase RecQ
MGCATALPILRLLSFEMFQQGMTPEEIAKERGCAIVMVHNHLMELWGSGEAIDIHQFVQPDEIRQIIEPVPILPEPLRLKDLFDYLESRFCYEKIRWVLAWKNKNG